MAERPVKGASARWFLIRRDGQRGVIVNLLTVPVQKSPMCDPDRQVWPGRFRLGRDNRWCVAAVAGRQDGDAFTFSVPETECSSVVLADKMVAVGRVEHRSGGSAGREASR